VCGLAKPGLNPELDTRKLQIVLDSSVVRFFSCSACVCRLCRFPDW
jgi:hypothetical protein